MILYNVTVSTEDYVHDEWLSWMMDKHIPDVMETGLFTEYKIYRIVTDSPEEKTYSIQYFLRSMEDYETYRDKFAPALQADFQNKYKDKFTAFRTIMELVE
ncbi:MAG: DUF4286 family protein [Ignavibacteria bacterium]